ncbi:hypothetical protein SETIT_1G313100v2 [Setaria italica]|uniref:Uncharacterized protein n=1 Tax=Setaria italica TaxID=4555 RepID=K3Z0K6_SETIT|nr:hypothetical protein SETIT_1G313100v2 [Setaria italica]
MAMMSKFVWSLMIAAVFMLLVVSGSARRLDGEKWTGEAASGDLHSMQFVKHLFLQQLGAGASGRSYDKNGPPSHP